MASWCMFPTSGPSGRTASRTAAIANALTNNTSLVELLMGNNKVGQNGAIAIRC